MKNNTEVNNNFLKPKTRNQIANELGISYSTFWRWLKKNDIILPSGLVFPVNQKIIYDVLQGKRIDKSASKF